MIEIRELSKVYKIGEVEVRALNGVSLTIEQGDFVAIMGPSGSGKSTLMHLLGLLDSPSSGSYKLLGEEVSHLKEDDLAALRSETIGFVFQQFNLLPRTTAFENVLLPSIYHSGKPSFLYAKELLEKVGLGNRADHKPSELSGGQQQRVAIARALINRPKILFADEPTGNLDSASEDEIIRLLQALNDQGITVILVTHELEVAEHAKRIIRMRDGKIQSDERRSPPSVSNSLSQSDSENKPLRSSFSRFFPFREFLQHFRQALRALAANKGRSALSMLGILIGVGAVIAMLALGKGARQSVESQLSSLGSNLLVLRPGSGRSMGVSLGAGSMSRLTDEDARELKEAISSIRRTSPSVTGRGQVVYGDKNWNTQVMGVTSDYFSMRSSDPNIGRIFTSEEDQKRARVAVVGRTIVRQLFINASPVGEFIKINRVLFQVIGILPEKGANGWRDQDDIILIPLQTSMKRLLGKEYVDSIDIEVNSSEEMTQTQEEILALMNQRHKNASSSQQDAFEVRNMADIQEALSETSRVLSWLLASIAAISLVVGGIGIMNIMLVSVTERTREIGLRKAIGAKSGDILSQFLIEAVVVSSMGGGLGILLGWGITLLLSTLAGWAASISGTSILLSSLFSGGVGVLFGLWPARKASRLNPIDALRHE